MDEYKAFEKLDLPRTASKDEILSQFRKLCISKHPDMGGTNDETIELLMARDIALAPIRNKIHAESSLKKIIEILGISFTIAGVIWGISYAILVESEHPTAMRDSLIIFSSILLLSLFVLARKHPSGANQF